MRTVGIIDYGMGNLDSVMRATEMVGSKALLLRKPDELSEVDYLILPGVGAFTDGMKNIKNSGMDIAIKQALERGTPLLGICLGMQLLATKGFEGGETAGLDLISGEVVRLQPHGNEKVPHVGWNTVEQRDGIAIFQGITPNKDFYFVHSFHFRCRDEENVLATTPYCGGFSSVVGRGSVYGVQFHPEKSQKVGFSVLKNFFNL